MAGGRGDEIIRSYLPGVIRCKLAPLKLNAQLIFLFQYQLKLNHRLFQFFFQNSVQIYYQNKHQESIVKMLQFQLLLQGVQWKRLKIIIGTDTYLSNFFLGLPSGLSLKVS